MNINAVHNLNDCSPALTQLVRLLARQAARDWHALHCVSDRKKTPSGIGDPN